MHVSGGAGDMWIIAHVQSASTKISRLGEVFAHVARSDLSIRAAKLCHQKSVPHAMHF
jgi:hypothetical protein